MNFTVEIWTSVREWQKSSLLATFKRIVRRGTARTFPSVYDLQLIAASLQFISLNFQPQAYSHAKQQWFIPTKFCECYKRITRLTVICKMSCDFTFCSRQSTAVARYPARQSFIVDVFVPANHHRKCFPCILLYSLKMIYFNINSQVLLLLLLAFAKKANARTNKINNRGRWMTSACAPNGSISSKKKSSSSKKNLRK